MSARKVHLAQTFIPTPPSPNAKTELSDEDKERLYRETMGNGAAMRQATAYADAHRCTCGKGDREPAWNHERGCHKIPLRFGRKP